MSTSREFLLLQFARFGALTNDQLKAICLPRMGEGVMYRRLGRLVDDGYVRKQSFRGHPRILNCVTSEGFHVVYEAPEFRYLPIREPDIGHTMAVTNAIILLSKYSKVVGVSTERERPAEGFRSFCFMRTPDGIAQMRGGGGVYEAAIEVETSRKSHEKRKALLDHYKMTFERGMPCKALFLFCGSKEIAESYRKLMAEMPEEVSKGVLIKEFDQLPFLPKAVFGDLNQDSPRGGELTVSYYPEGIAFGPMKSINWKQKLAPEGTHTDSQSQTGRI